MLEQAISELTKHIIALNETLKAAKPLDAKPKATRRSSKKTTTKAEPELAATQEQIVPQPAAPQVQVDPVGAPGATVQAPPVQAAAPVEQFPWQAPLPSATQSTVPAQPAPVSSPPAHAVQAPVQAAQPLPPPTTQEPTEFTRPMLIEIFSALYRTTGDPSTITSLLSPYGATSTMDLDPKYYRDAYYKAKEIITAKGGQA